MTWQSRATCHGLRCRPRVMASAHVRRPDVPTLGAIGFQRAFLGCVRSHAAARSTPDAGVVHQNVDLSAHRPSWSESRGRRSRAALAMGSGGARARRHRLKHGGRTEPTRGLMLPKRPRGRPVARCRSAVAQHDLLHRSTTDAIDAGEKLHLPCPAATASWRMRASGGIALPGPWRKRRPVDVDQQPCS